MALQQSGLRTKVLMNRLAKLKLSREECGKTTLPTTWGSGLIRSLYHSLCIAHRASCSTPFVVLADLCDFVQHF